MVKNPKDQNRPKVQCERVTVRKASVAGNHWKIEQKSQTQGRASGKREFQWREKRG